MNAIRTSLAATVLALTTCSFQSMAQTSDQILKKHAEVMGGADKWKNIKSIKMIGNFTVENEAAKVLFNYTIAEHEGIRKEYTYDDTKATAYVVITPKDGWTYIPQPGMKSHVEGLPEVTINKFRFFLDAQDPLINYKAKGNKVTYAGKEEKYGKQCYKFEIVPGYDKEFTEIMYLDTATYLNVTTGMKSKAHGEMDLIKYSDYQQTPEGIMYPMTFNEGAGPQTIDKLEINAPIDANTFKINP